MKQIICENVNAPYSLHDMNVIGFEVINNSLIMRTQSGMVKTSFPYTQTDGYVELVIFYGNSAMYTFLALAAMLEYLQEKKYSLRTLSLKTPLLI